MSRLKKIEAVAQLLYRQNANYDNRSMPTSAEGIALYWRVALMDAVKDNYRRQAEEIIDLVLALEEET